MASTLIILPVAVGAFYLVVHLSLLFHTRHVANAAAQDALSTAQQNGATVEDAEDRAREVLALSGAFRGDPDIEIDLGNDDSNTVTVTIVAQADTLIGRFSDATVSIAGPKERFYLESERQ